MCKYRIDEVAAMVGVSVQTINNWYRYKRENPNDSRVAMLPEYLVEGSRGLRLWDNLAVEALKSFKLTLPRGCSGIMGSVTQRYAKRGCTKVVTPNGGGGPKVVFEVHYNPTGPVTFTTQHSAGKKLQKTVDAGAALICAVMITDTLESLGYTVVFHIATGQDAPTSTK